VFIAAGDNGQRAGTGSAISTKIPLDGPLPLHRNAIQAVLGGVIDAVDAVILDSAADNGVSRAFVCSERRLLYGQSPARSP
jgi:hypothetical protein